MFITPRWQIGWKIIEMPEQSLLHGIDIYSLPIEVYICILINVDVQASPEKHRVSFRL